MAYYRNAHFLSDKSVSHSQSCMFIICDESAFNSAQWLYHN